MPHDLDRPLASWRAMHADTAAWAEEIQLKFFREAPAWRKLEMAGDLRRGVLELAESGIRIRHPHASDTEVRRLLADIVLGAELAARVYGPLPRHDSAGEDGNT